MQESCSIQSCTYEIKSFYLYYSNILIICLSGAKFIKSMFVQVAKTYE